eukprot:5091691-Pyramimonas_sp.AAC.1
MMNRTPVCGAPVYASLCFWTVRLSVLLVRLDKPRKEAKVSPAFDGTRTSDGEAGCSGRRVGSSAAHAGFGAHRQLCVG